MFQLWQIWCWKVHNKSVAEAQATEPCSPTKWKEQRMTVRDSTVLTNVGLIKKQCQSYMLTDQMCLLVPTDLQGNSQKYIGHIGYCKSLGMVWWACKRIIEREFRGESKQSTFIARGLRKPPLGMWSLCHKQLKIFKGEMMKGRSELDEYTVPKWSKKEPKQGKLLRVYCNSLLIENKCTWCQF